MYETLEEIWKAAFHERVGRFENIKEFYDDDGHHWEQITRCTDEGLICETTVSLPGHDSVTFYNKLYR